MPHRGDVDVLKYQHESDVQQLNLPYIAYTHHFRFAIDRGTLHQTFSTRNMKAFTRAQQITKQVAYAQTKHFTQSAPSMQLDMNSTLRMKSGFEIPVLGYGG
jgi:hypothetical protein